MGPKLLHIYVSISMHTHAILVCIYLNRILYGPSVLLCPIPSMWPVGLHQRPKTFCICTILVFKQSFDTIEADIFPFFPSSFLADNEIDIRPFNRRKTNLIYYYGWGPQRYESPGQSGNYMPPWAKEWNRALEHQRGRAIHSNLTRADVG